jgi:hypothetical protein|tara:strand:- start:20 stop:1336 length:1317 start_codon:yes stop_codon:yes gene_type:complete
MAQRVAPKEINYDQSLPLAIESRSNRRKFAPNNGQTFTPGGSNIIRIDINADSMLDPAHSYLQFTFTNTTSGGTGQACGLEEGVGMIQRLRIESAGVVLEDIQAYNRLYAMLQQVQAGPLVGLDGNVESGNSATLVDTTAARAANAHDQIAASGTKVICVPLVSALLNLDKYIPLVMMNAGLTLELTLAPATEAICLQHSDATADYSISSVNYVAQLIDLDRSFYDNLRMVMEAQGGVLQLAGQTFRHYQQTVAANANEQTATLNIPARVKSLKSCFVRMVKQSAQTDNDKYYAQVGDKVKTSSFQFKIGATNYPQSAVNCGSAGAASAGAEAFVELKKALGKLGDYSHSTSITQANFGISNTDLAQAASQQTFTIGYDFEAFQKSALESGVNTADRSLPMSLELTLDNDNAATRVDAFVLADAIFYVSMDGSVSVSV